MNLLQDILTYIRRIIKTPSNAQITDSLLIDYVNRFWIMDVDARMQLFDLKTKYQFQTQPGVDKYNMPLYAVQSETTSNDPNYQVYFYPVYQGFLAPAFVNGIQVPFYTIKNSFYNIWPNYVQNNPAVATGNGGSSYTLQIPLVNNIGLTVNQVPPGLLRGYVDITGVISYANSLSLPPSAFSDPIYTNTINPTAINFANIFPYVYITSQDANGNNVVVSDSGMFLSQSGNQPYYGLLIASGQYPYGYSALTNPTIPLQPYSTTSNTVNYITGEINVNFPVAIPAGQNINVQTYFYEPGLPRAILFDNNCLTLRNPPDIQYLVEIDAYLTPAAFFNQSQAIQFAYMAEYIARGAARKILSDTGDIEQFAFYEPLFKEQELLVWKRSQRQITANRSETIYSNTGFGNGFATNGLYGSGAT